MKTINVACVAAAMAMLGGCAIDEQGGVDGDEAVAVAEQAATQADVWHASWNGGSVDASSYGYLSSAYVSAFEYKSGSTRYAYVNLSKWSVDPTSQQCFTWTDWWGGTYDYCYYTRYSYTWGWGSIPEHDLQISPNAARLRTELSSNFGGYTCTWDWYNWQTSGCTSLAGGSVDLKWNKNGGYSTFSSGTSQTEYGAYTFKAQGTYRSSSAQATGSFLGETFDSAYGSFSDTRGVNVTRSVLKTPNP
jgi:hypothetical protein